MSRSFAVSARLGNATPYRHDWTARHRIGTTRERDTVSGQLNSATPYRFEIAADMAYRQGIAELYAVSARHRADTPYQPKKDSYGVSTGKGLVRRIEANALSVRFEDQRSQRPSLSLAGRISSAALSNSYRGGLFSRSCAGDRSGPPACCAFQFAVRPTRLSAVDSRCCRLRRRGCPTTSTAPAHRRHQIPRWRPDAGRSRSCAGPPIAAGRAPAPARARSGRR